MGQGKLTAADHSTEWPASLKRLAKKARHDGESWQPVVINMHQRGAQAKLDELLENNNIRQIIDNYDEQYAELIVSRHPQLYQSSLDVKRESLKEYLEKHFGEKKSWQLGSWVYYPWSGNLVHILEKELFLESRTIRNKDLINEHEQYKYAEFTVGCAGMSVGSNVALSLAISGGSQKIKLADGAVISASNLNRIMTGVHDVGNSKSLAIARKLYEMVREIPEGDVRIRQQDNHWIEVSAGRSRFRLVGLDPREFPAMPEPPSDEDVERAKASLGVVDKKGR